MQKAYLVGTTSPLSATNSHDVILIGHAIWPKLSRTNVSHDEYGVCESLCKRSERWRRPRRFGDAPDIGDVEALSWSISNINFIAFPLFTQTYTSKRNRNRTQQPLQIHWLKPLRYIHHIKLCASICPQSTRAIFIKIKKKFNQSQGNEIQLGISSGRFPIEFDKVCRFFFFTQSNCT